MSGEEDPLCACGHDVIEHQFHQIGEYRVECLRIGCGCDDYEPIGEGLMKTYGLAALVEEDDQW